MQLDCQIEKWIEKFMLNNISYNQTLLIGFFFATV